MRSCLADEITASMLRDDGLHIGRPRSVSGGVHNATLQSQQKAVENYEKDVELVR